MYQESEVLLAILDELRSQDIPALGLHDGLLVPQSKANEAEGLMGEVSKKVTGTSLPTSGKSLG